MCYRLEEQIIVLISQEPKVVIGGNGFEILLLMQIVFKQCKFNPLFIWRKDNDDVETEIFLPPDDNGFSCTAGSFAELVRANCGLIRTASSTDG
jgi:hypothetical protein